MKKLLNGSIFTIPCENGNFGLGQILEKSHGDKPNWAMMALFDCEFTLKEISELHNFSFLAKATILAIAPLDTIKLNKKTSGWNVVGTIPVVTTKIPMMRSFISDPNEATKKTGIAYNFEKTKYRYISEKEYNRLLLPFDRSSIYFESLLNIRFSNKNYLDIFPNIDKSNWYLKWPENCMTEEDIIINNALYKDWEWTR